MSFNFPFRTGAASNAPVKDKIQPSHSWPRLSGASLFLVSVLGGHGLQAQTFEWTGEATSGSSTNQWHQAENWNPVGVPDGPTVDVVLGDFTGDETPSNNSNVTVRSLSFTRDTGSTNLRLFSNTLTVLETWSVTGEASNFVRSGGGIAAADLVVTDNLQFGLNQSSSNRFIGTVTISGTTTFEAGSEIEVRQISDAMDLGDLQMNDATFHVLSGTSSDRGTTDGGLNEITISRLNGTGVIRGSKSATLPTTAHLTVDGSTDGVFSGTIIDGAANNILQLTKTGSGSLTLTGANDFSGGTVLSGGTLVLGHSSAAGHGEIQVGGTSEAVLRIAEGVQLGNDLVFGNTAAGSKVERVLAASETFNTGVGELRSEFVPWRSATVSFLAGTTSSGTTLELGFSTSSTAANDGLRLSDILSLTGTDNDMFVLQLSMNTSAEEGFLGWFDPDSERWVNAVDGNTGNNASGTQLGYEGTFAAFQTEFGSDLSSYVGAYGNDGAGSVWAVLNHNSQFAVIPEPSSAALVVVALLGGWAGSRRRNSIFPAKISIT